MAIYSIINNIYNINFNVTFNLRNGIIYNLIKTKFTRTNNSLLIVEVKEQSLRRFKKL